MPISPIETSSCIKISVTELVSNFKYPEKEDFKSNIRGHTITTISKRVCIICLKLLLKKLRIITICAPCPYQDTISPQQRQPPLSSILSDTITASEVISNKVFFVIALDQIFSTTSSTAAVVLNKTAVP